jgi:hypothetical protein
LVPNVADNPALIEDLVVPAHPEEQLAQLTVQSTVLRSISGTIGEVVNLSAELFQNGYQYRSLNACRLAISSDHESVDG